MESKRLKVAVVGPFDDLGSRCIRFLREASQLGAVHVLAWSDALIQARSGKAPRFPEAERRYFLSSLRYVERVHMIHALSPEGGERGLPEVQGFKPDIWATDGSGDPAAQAAFCKTYGIGHRCFQEAELQGWPDDTASACPSERKKVMVTGCYDWFHSGHVRFFEEVSAHGDLYVVVGHDANIRLLKGEGHPLFPDRERRFVVGSIRFVTQALVSTGEGWLDADPEIRRIKPDIYAVNEDGDKGGKREYCEKMGIHYLVLKREPAPGLPRRSSTDLRGF